MSELFNRGELRDYLSNRVQSCLKSLESMAEDEVLSRTTDDIVLELIRAAWVEPLNIEESAIDGGVVEAKVDMYDHFENRQFRTSGFRIHAIFQYSGNTDLLYYTPTTRLITRFNADVSPLTITVHVEQSGSTPNPVTTKQAIDHEIGNIRAMAGHSLVDVNSFNTSLDGQLRPAVERRKTFLQDRRELAGALGFPLKKRTGAPAPVPLQRKAMGVQRSNPVGARRPYRDEPALTEDQYEDAADVISSALLSMERTPSVVAGKGEEDLRDYILVMLNGTFQGNATGETFVKSGKTDILVRVDDRHVFVGECKW